MSRGRLLGALAAFLAAGLIAAPLALADHGHNAQQQKGYHVKGVVQSFTLTPTSTTSGTSASPADIGSLAVLTFDRGTVTVTVTSATRLEMTAAVLVDKFVGDAANVTVVQTGSQLVAKKVEFQSSTKASDHQVTRGTIVSVTPPSGSSAGSMVIRTGSGTVTAPLDSNVVVLVGDNTPGSVQDLTVGARIHAVWKQVNGSYGVVLVRVLGHKHKSSGN